MYQVIARKYRPQTFDDVVNQEHVKRTLQNALLQGRIGHGYIFSGQRGTGKTTMARILAKALNCEKGPTAEPCCECLACSEIAAGNAMDLVEIDAASNRRIDDIRELRENVRYRPARDRYKVFIIDEAHQITADAFNALLKTLEEPPEWVVFVLCTTEPHQFPSTIVSRCQSFPFRTVEHELVVGHLRKICEQEGVEADEDALVAIALAGDGSIRDSLSTLDQAIASFGNKLEAGLVRDLLGAVPADIIDAITSALREGKAEKMLDVVARLSREGRHLQHFSGEMARYFRNLLVMKVSGTNTRLIAAGDDERSRMSSVLESFSEEDLTRYLQLSLDLYSDLQHATQPRFRLEVGLLKLVHAGRLTPIEKVLAEWEGSGSAPAIPEPHPAAGGGSSRRALSAETGAESGPDKSFSSQPVATPAAVSEDTGTSAAVAVKSEKGVAAPDEGGLQTAVVSDLRQRGEEFTADAIEHAVVERENGQVEIRPAPQDVVALQMNFRAVEEAIRRIEGKKVHVKLGNQLATDSSSSTTLAASQAAPPAGNGSAAAEASISPAGPMDDTEARERALADPEVQEFHKIFGGRIREVRDLRRYSS